MKRWQLSHKDLVKIQNATMNLDKLALLHLEHGKVSKDKVLKEQVLLAETA